MHKVDLERAAGEVEVSVPSPAELACWELSKDERVYFRYQDLVGFSKEIKLGSQVSLCASSMVFGRMRHHYAEGPGRLYLRTMSDAMTNKSAVGRRSHNSKQLVAWNSNSKFNLDANLNIADTLFSDYNLSIQNENGANMLVLYDSHATRGKTFRAGIIRFSSSFLLPI